MPDVLSTPTEAPQDVKNDRPSGVVPSGWASDPVATLAAQLAFEKGANEDECFNAALAAVEAVQLDEIEDAEIDAEYLESTLEHDYYISVCNLARGVADLTTAEAKKAAAAYGVPYVSFQTWQRRIGV